MKNEDSVELAKPI